MLEQIKKLCSVCGNPIDRKANRFCSSKCYGIAKIGEKHSWGNKIGDALRGKPKTAEHTRKSVEARKGQKRPTVAGENSYAWKGDGVGYDALHDWVRFRKPRPEKCEHCGIIGERSGEAIPHWTIHWANKSHKYKRDLNDWIALCRKCHYQYDNQNH